MSNAVREDIEKISRIYEKGNYLKAYAMSLYKLIEMEGYKEEQFVKDAIKDSNAELLAIIGSGHTSPDIKFVARTLLNCAYGEKAINRIIEKLAVVTDRNDRLVSNWRKTCLLRDGNQCGKCESKDDLCVHHISYWSGDPVNRINVDNGITLCSACHKKEHEDDWFSAFIR